MKELKDMTPREFAEWAWTHHDWSGQAHEGFVQAIERWAVALLEAAAERHRAACRRNGGTQQSWENAAILGKPRFVEGQIVRMKGMRAIAYWGSDLGDDRWEPVKIEPLPDGGGRVRE